MLNQSMIKKSFLMFAVMGFITSCGKVKMSDTQHTGDVLTSLNLKTFPYLTSAEQDIFLKKFKKSCRVKPPIEPLPPVTTNNETEDSNLGGYTIDREIDCLPVCRITKLPACVGSGTIGAEPGVISTPIASNCVHEPVCESEMSPAEGATGFISVENIVGAVLGLQEEAVEYYLGDCPVPIPQPLPLPPFQVEPVGPTPASTIEELQLVK